MNGDFRKQLTDSLIDAGIIKAWSEIQTNSEQVAVETEQIDSSDIGTASDGTLQ